ncbi:hypothetical protein QE357_005052 [Siphonobacter sp. BAB-5404]|nr:hypothetical protein [Siphonobacter sp. SORGH_AS_0500]
MTVLNGNKLCNTTIYLHINGEKSIVWEVSLEVNFVVKQR